MQEKEPNSDLGEMSLHGETGIVLGHKISRRGIEVDKAKIEVIAKLSPPKSIQDIRSFLGHARFYRRFIKDFRKIARPLTNLLAKDVTFDFNDGCFRSWEKLKQELIFVPIIQLRTGLNRLRSCVMPQTLPLALS